MPHGITRPLRLCSAYRCARLHDACSLTHVRLSVGSAQLLELPGIRRLLPCRPVRATGVNGVLPLLDPTRFARAETAPATVAGVAPWGWSGFDHSPRVRSEPGRCQRKLQRMTPTHYKPGSRALNITEEGVDFTEPSVLWQTRQDSNLRPLPPEGSALSS